MAIRRFMAAQATAAAAPVKAVGSHLPRKARAAVQSLRAAPPGAATFRHDSPPARPIAAAVRQRRCDQMPCMSPRAQPPAEPAASAARRAALCDWLALLMLLAGSVVWPR
jgi:hypothetical protein